MVIDLSKLAGELGSLTVQEAAELSNMLRARWRIQADSNPPGDKLGVPRGDRTEAADATLFWELVLQSRDIELRRLSKGEKKGKNPDFKLVNKTELCGYCELKSPRDDWIFEPADKAEGERPVAEMRPSPTSNNPARQIKSAAEQFDAVNPNHELPNILVFVNHAPGRTRSDLYVTLAGMPVPGGPSLFTLTLDHQKDVWEAARRIDLFLWIDPQKRTWQPLCPNDAVHRATVCSLFGIQDGHDRSGAVSAIK
jgi:hypothetical protein